MDDRLLVIGHGKAKFEHHYRTCRHSDRRFRAIGYTLDRDHPWTACANSCPSPIGWWRSGDLQRHSLGSKCGGFGGFTRVLYLPMLSVSILEHEVLHLHLTQILDPHEKFLAYSNEIHHFLLYLHIQHPYQATA